MFEGFIKTGCYEIDYISEQLREITITISDLLCVILDLAELLPKKQLVVEQKYRPMEELCSNLASILQSGAGLFTGLVSPVVNSYYDSSKWTPYYYNNLSLFDQADYTINYNGQTSQLERFLRISSEAGRIRLDYVYYVEQQYRPYNQILATGWLREYLVWKAYYIDGANKTVICDVNETRYWEDEFPGHNQTNSDGDNYSEWVSGLWQRRLRTLYPYLAPNEVVTLQDGVNTYKINNGKLLFTGSTNFEEIIACTATEISILEWIRALGHINAVWIDIDGAEVKISNKMPLGDTPIAAAFPDELLKLRVVANNLMASKFGMDISYMQMGQAISDAVNSYFNGIMSSVFRNTFEIEMSGYYPEVVGKRYVRVYLMYVTSASYDIDKDIMKITAQGRG
jgi:hypothetical protein